MQKEAVFTIKIEPDLRDAFKAEAAAEHRPASQIARELMRDFVERKQKEREYRDFLQHKADKARAQIDRGLGQTNDAVKTTFAERRESLLSAMKEASDT